MTRVVLIDDHPIYRSGLAGVIEGDKVYEIIGEAGNAREGLRLAEKLRPDIAVVDLRLPDKSGIRLTQEIRDVPGNTRVMIISAHSGTEYVDDAFRAGATGYVIKESGADIVLQCLEFITAGKRFFDPLLSDKLYGRLTPGDAPVNREKDIADKYETLTPREQEVMRLLLRKLSLKEISYELRISYKTVSVHKSNLMKKLGLRNDMDLAEYTAETGLTDPYRWG